MFIDRKPGPLTGGTHVRNALKIPLYSLNRSMAIEATMETCEKKKMKLAREINFNYRLKRLFRFFGGAKFKLISTIFASDRFVSFKSAFYAEEHLSVRCANDAF